MGQGKEWGREVWTSGLQIRSPWTTSLRPGSPNQGRAPLPLNMRGSQFLHIRFGLPFLLTSNLYLFVKKNCVGLFFWLYSRTAYSAPYAIWYPEYRKNTIPNYVFVYCSTNKLFLFYCLSIHFFINSISNVKYNFHIIVLPQTSLVNKPVNRS
jgi:hypothetical protein